RIRVIVNELWKIDPSIDVSAVIKDHPTQIADDRDRIPQLGIQDKELVAAHRNRNQWAIGGAGPLAERDISNRSCFIGRKPSQGGAAAGEETLAGRYIAARKGGCKSHPDTVGEH